MQHFKRIIIPVENTENSKKVVRKGALLAKLLGIKVCIITVNDTHHFISSVVLEEKLQKEASAFLDDFKRIVEDFSIQIETKLIVGKPAEEIVKFAREDDLIIIAYHDKIKGIDKIIDKSISIDVIKNAPCSVFVVKSNQ
jgi:nucleotide-binding universal stress UspA family protein